MPQVEPQNAPASRRGANNAGRRFGRPLNGNADKLARLAERERKIKQRMRSLAREFGGLSAMSAVDLALLREAASLIVQRVVGTNDRMRRANALARLLRTVEKRRGRRETPPGAFFATALGNGE